MADIAYSVLVTPFGTTPIPGPVGPSGPSAYSIAVANGFVGTQAQWLSSLDGESAYQVWLENGNSGTEGQFLASLVGPSAYQSWLNLGNNGTEAAFIAAITGVAGQNAYQVWLSLGNTGTEQQFITSLTGPQGPSGYSAYSIAVQNGFVGSQTAWLTSLIGPSGTSKWSSLTGVPTTFPPSPHTHAESDVTGLVAALNSLTPLTTNIATSGSVTGGGHLSGLLTISLVNDNANPGPSYFYATDLNSVKHWMQYGSAALISTPTLNTATAATAGVDISVTTTTFIPQGTQIKSDSTGLIFTTNIGATITTGQGDAVFPCTCTTTGTIGNGLFDLNSLVTPIAGVTCVSSTTSTGGTNGGYANASSTQVVIGNDTRLTNARAPLAHALSHGFGGSDPISIHKAQISDFPGVVTTSLPGLVPVLPTSNAANLYFRGDGSFSAIVPGVGFNVPWSALINFQLATPTTWGAVPPLHSNTVVASGSGIQTQVWLRGDDSWSVLPQYTYSTGTFQVPAVGATTTVQVAPAVTWPQVGGMVYFSDGSTRGFLDVTAAAGPQNTVTVKNQGYNISNVPGTTVNVPCELKLMGPGVATATVAGYVPQPPNNTYTFLRGDGTFAGLTLSTISQAGAIPNLPATTGAGSQTKTWLRGDNSWQQLPEVSYASAGFTVPAIGSTVTVQLYAPYPPWPSVPTGTVYFSDGTYRGYMGISSYNAGTGALTLTNRGNAVAGNTPGADCLIKLDAPGVCSATNAGFVPTPPNNITTFLRGDGTFATPPAATATVTGYVPTPPNNISTFLRGDATFAVPVNAGQVTFQFGATDTGDDTSLRQTVSAAWLLSTSCPTVSIFGGPDHPDDESYAEAIIAYVVNPVVGVSFDIIVEAPTGTWGQWYCNYISN